VRWTTTWHRDVTLSTNHRAATKWKACTSRVERPRGLPCLQSTIPDNHTQWASPSILVDRQIQGPPAPYHNTEASPPSASPVLVHNPLTLPMKARSRLLCALVPYPPSIQFPPSIYESQIPRTSKVRHQTMSSHLIMHHIWPVDP